MAFSEEARNRSQEKVLWRSNKYIFMFPWPFTEYQVTEDRVFLKTGMLKTNMYETRLYRITDVKLSQTIFQRIFGTYTVELTTRDKDSPIILLQNIMQGFEVKELISGLVEESRRKNRVITTDAGYF